MDGISRVFAASYCFAQRLKFLFTKSPANKGAYQRQRQDAMFRGLGGGEMTAMTGSLSEKAIPV